MQTISVTLALEAQTAQIYADIPHQEQEKLQQIFNVLVNEHNQLPNLLGLIMDAISLRAEQRGLTPEILEQLLKDAH